MKLVILGATGGTGLEIAGQAIQQGHLATAFVRSPDKLKKFGDHLAVTQGDPLSSTELREVIRNHHAVVSGFGPRLPIAKSDRDLLRRFARALTAAMHEAAVRRVVVLSTAFLFTDSIIPPAALFGRLFFPDVVTDSAQMEEIFRGSGLDWTMVRPPRLTDGPGKGRYRVREGHLPAFGFSISRADVAGFMLKAVEDRSSIGKIIGIAN